MERIPFTDNQKKAHDFSRHISVTANAGSGKTMVLANRFLYILLSSNTNIEELVAITFTDKAAGELKKRIADTVDNIIFTTTDKNLKKKCQNIRSHLASANISTIHSFCAKILRLNPVEANIDVSFSILEGIDKKILIDESINETFSAILKNPESKQQSELVNLLRLLNKRKLFYLINFLIDKREQVEKLISDNCLYQKSDEEILQFWKDQIVTLLLREIDISSLSSVLHSLTLVDKNIFNHLISKLEYIKSCTDSDNKHRTLIEIQEILSQFLKNKSKSSATDINNFDLLKQYNKKLDALLKEFKNLEQNKIILNHTRIIIDLYKSVLNKYEQKKFEKSYLDYEDLQLKTRELLKNPEVQKSLSKKYKYIMIDEYQDTNFLQYEIFLPLLEDLKKGNLFIVGDPKQSIFGFRNAEVEVFEKTKTDILNISNNKNDLFYNGEYLQSTTEEKRGQIVLSENFRLLTDIIAFVNLLFKKLLGNVEHEFDVSYQELIKGRNNSNNGRVELMLNILNGSKADKDSEEEDSAAQELEFKMIAQRIIKLKQEKYPIYEASRSTKFEETARNFEFGDAAILIRSRTYLKKLEYWLYKYNIPYIISGGIGFYQTQEIYDFYNYFQFLLNNQDEVALVGILRSPFFCISDAELYEIAIMDDDIDFWSKVCNYASTGNASGYLKRAVSILKENISYAARLPIPILVQNIFRQTGWIGTIAGIQRGEQSKLNLNKLLSIAREFEGKGFNNLFDFVERLKTLIEREEREGQANISKERKAVQIMTIHSAKGLEFPVVFVPFLNKNFKMEYGHFVDIKYGIGFKTRNDEEEFSETPLYNFLKYRSRMKTLAEEKRLLYVACTRARDLLILSGTLKQNTMRNNFNCLKWILDSLEINQSLNKELVFPKQKVKSITYRDNKFVSEEFEHDLKIPIITSLDELIISHTLELESFTPKTIKQILIQNLPASLKYNFYSATQIQTYNSCPMKYFLKYQLGFPETENQLYTFNEESEPDDKIYSEQIGLGVHKILEKYPKYNENEITNFLHNFLPVEAFNNPIEFEKTIKIILTHVRNYFNSDIYKEISTYKDFKNEFTINSQFGENFITGTMDKIIYDEKNKWIVVDYKTDRVKEKNLENLASKYIHQIRFYAFLISRMFNQDQVNAIIIFTEKASDNYYKFNFTTEELKAIECSINEAINNISKGNFKMNTQMCEYCSYQKEGKCIGANIPHFN